MGTEAERVPLVKMDSDVAIGSDSEGGVPSFPLSELQTRVDARNADEAIVNEAARRALEGATSDGLRLHDRLRRRP